MPSSEFFIVLVLVFFFNKQWTKMYMKSTTSFMYDRYTMYGHIGVASIFVKGANQNWRCIGHCSLLLWIYGPKVLVEAGVLIGVIVAICTAWKTTRCTRQIHLNSWNKADLSVADPLVSGLQSCNVVNWSQLSILLNIKEHPIQKWNWEEFWHLDVWNTK